MAETEANFHVVAIAGSETVTTRLSGIIDYLCQNPAVIKMLANKLRSVMSIQAELTIANLSQLPYLRVGPKRGLTHCLSSSEFLTKNCAS